MKIIESNGQFNIYGGNSIMTYSELPANYYKVCFNENNGFWIELHPEMQLKEDKIYGSHDKKADKVLNSFNMFNRNLGVMISGNKGMGKSLFARLLSRKAIKRGLPVIDNAIKAEPFQSEQNNQGGFDFISDVPLCFSIFVHGCKRGHRKSVCIRFISVLCSAALPI